LQHSVYLQQSLNNTQPETAYFAPVPPPNELDETYPLSLILAHSFCCAKTWCRQQSRKYITCCTVVTKRTEPRPHERLT